jgi:hypothetical protein
MQEDRRENMFDMPVQMFSTEPQRKMFLPIFIMSSADGLKHKDTFLPSAFFINKIENK